MSKIYHMGEAEFPAAFCVLGRQVMLEGEKPARLIWVTKNYAVNPAQIVLVFHGNDGHVEVWLTNGQSKSITDRELTDEGRTLLLPVAVVDMDARICAR